MFENLKKYRNIIVTGPQRSGTRICAQMIAHDTGHKYIDEKALGCDSMGLLRKFLEKPYKKVIQCPGLSHIAHKLPDGVLVVFMRRCVEDIKKSEERINWSDDARTGEQKKYGTKNEISKVKYEYWDRVQKDKVKNKLGVPYESLSKHPLWISKERRKNFRWAQTK